MSTFGEIAGPITTQWRINTGHRIFLLMIICGSLYLLLANLGNQYLWQDEAQTALVSKTILTDGVPHGYDGKNFFSQQDGAEYGNNYIWRWHTWLPFYVLAGSYKILGISTFASRLPFILFGLGTIISIYFFAKALLSSTRISLIAAALLGVSVPFLLLCRQCRYYSMIMFFSVLSLYAYIAMLNKKKYAVAMLFVSSTLLFHSQHIYVAVLFATVLLHAAIFRRDRLIVLLVVIVVTVLVNGPWLVWMSGIKYEQSRGFRLLLHPCILMVFTRIPLMDIIRYVFPLWLLAVVVIVVIAGRIRTGRLPAKDLIFWERLLLLIFFIMFNIIMAVITSPYPFFRYIAPSIPLLIMLIAVIIDAAVRVHPILAVAIVAVLLSTSQLKDFLYEITHDFDGPSKGIACYLNKHGSPNDIVAITYGDMPLKFYTKMRIVGGLTGEDLGPARNARWVIIRKYAISGGDMAVGEYMLNNVNWGKYRRIVLNYPDTLWDNREDPTDHYFRTCTDEDRVVIYERID